AAAARGSSYSARAWSQTASSASGSCPRALNRAGTNGIRRRTSRNTEDVIPSTSSSWGSGNPGRIGSRTTAHPVITPDGTRSVTLTAVISCRPPEGQDFALEVSSELSPPQKSLPHSRWVISGSANCGKGREPAENVEATIGSTEPNGNQWEGILGTCHAEGRG